MYDEEFDRMSPDLYEWIERIKHNVNPQIRGQDFADLRNCVLKEERVIMRVIIRADTLIIVSRRHVTFDPVPLRLAARPVNLQ